MYFEQAGARESLPVEVKTYSPRFVSKLCFETHARGYCWSLNQKLQRVASSKSDIDVDIDVDVDVDTDVDVGIWLHLGRYPKP